MRIHRSPLTPRTLQLPSPRSELQLLLWLLPSPKTSAPRTQRAPRPSAGREEPPVAALGVTREDWRVGIRPLATVAGVAPGSATCRAGRATVASEMAVAAGQKVDACMGVEASTWGGP